MGIQVEFIREGRRNAHGIYQDYLNWFREHALEWVAPKEEDELPSFQLFNEDSFDGERITLNRVYFIIPLSPLQSRSGRLELFSFSELNFMERSLNYAEVDEIVNLIPVEYRIE